MDVWFVTGTLLCAPLCFGAPEKADLAPPTHDSQTPISPKKTSAVQDILKMMDAGVSKEVIKAYVENSRPGNPTAEDLITLKKHDVPDDITTALVKRMAEVKPRPISPRVDGGGSTPMPAPGPANYQNASRLDPESYEFWWYHYAYPRTLSYAYERLYPYSPISPYQYYRPIPFSPHFGYPGAAFP